MTHRRLWWDGDRNEGVELWDGQMRDAEGRPFVELTLEEDGLDVTVRVDENQALMLEAALRAWRMRPPSCRDLEGVNVQCPDCGEIVPIPDAARRIGEALT